MNLVTLLEPLSVTYRKSSGGAQITFEAGKVYLIANNQLERISQDENVRSRIYRVSKAENRIHHFCATTARKLGHHRILLYNGSGGFGDQIMTWPLARLLASMGFEVHVLADPGNNICWWNFPWVKTVHLLPCPWEVVKLYDDFLCFETVNNTDEHQDQLHPLDTMLAQIGIDPASVDPALKVVRPNFTHSEAMAVQGRLTKPFGVYQMASANPVRCLPPSESVFLLMKLAEGAPDLHWYALYDEFVPVMYKETIEQKLKEVALPNVEPVVFANLRELWALSTNAKVVVSPDSMMVHVAGCMEVPCIGLWGPINPDNRVKYYKNHHPIWQRELCIHAPCFCYSSTFPKFCPPRPTPRTTCEVLAGVSPYDVLEKVRQVRLP